jgi:hypothetical protein
MTARHAAAFALMGWYLIAAPPGTTPASLSQWRIVGTYDKASDCQEKLSTPGIVTKFSIAARKGSTAASIRLERRNRLLQVTQSF